VFPRTALDQYLCRFSSSTYLLPHLVALNFLAEWALVRSVKRLWFDLALAIYQTAFQASSFFFLNMPMILALAAPVAKLLIYPIWCE
jgi:hypothetical protein